MSKNEIKRYQVLNTLADLNGTIIFGGTDDREIPLCELKQAFELDSKLYNRSISELTINNAIELFDTCVAPLHPECVLLHIGVADLKFFEETPSEFDKKYCELIQHIKATNAKCDIAIISLKNYSQDASITELNKHLKYVADSEHCEFGDISVKRVWNPRQTKDIASFLYSTGFIRPLKIKRPIYDLAKILFCYEPSCIV